MAQPQHDRTAIRVLIVEDHAESREGIAEYLTLCGFEVSTAADGLQGIEAARNLQPQVIVMDLAMPVLDGWEATRRLKADWSTRHIPIIALSAFGGQPQARELALALGCEELLTKPVQPKEVQQEIRRLTALQRAEPPTSQN
ncbi:MAG TPA: response regulator [Thermoanaerobaculia bacterium]|jgi:CheY-like chemotaxis protein|nr:response regulator [Thermoanaerobaculia bacterium]